MDDGMAQPVRRSLSLLIMLSMLALQAIALMACGSDNNSASSAPTPTPVTFPQACSGQSLVAIDPINNVGYVAIYALDQSGNAQLAVVDLTVGAANPVLKTISL